MSQEQKNSGGALVDVLRRNRVLGVAILAAAILAGPVSSRGASAEISLCRTDPLVHLSDGTVVQLRSTIADTASDVQLVSYSLNAPAGTHVVSVTYTGGALQGKESVSFSATNKAKTYDSDTVVTAGTSGADVTTQMRIPGVGTSSTSGTTGQDLTTHISQ